MYTQRHEQYHFQQGLIAPYFSSGVEMYYLKFHQGIQRWGICLYCFTSSGENTSYIPLVYTPLMCTSYSVQCTPTTLFIVHYDVRFAPLCTIYNVHASVHTTKCTTTTVHTVHFTWTTGLSIYPLKCLFTISSATTKMLL